MSNKIILFAIGFLIWCALLWPVDTQHAIIGLVVSATVAILTGDLFTRRANLFFQPQRYLWFFVYVIFFIWEWLKANVSIAVFLMKPDMSLSPGIIAIRTSLKSEIALTVLANTLTLTKETITVDVDKENGVIYLHWINTGVRDAAKSLMVEKFEKILKKIYEC